MAVSCLNEGEWRLENEHGSFLVSNRISLLDRNFINTAFATTDMFWARELPMEQLEVMLRQSVTFGLYEETPAAPPPATVGEPSSPREESPTLEQPPGGTLVQVGLARIVTDHVTFAYLSDVYLLPEYRGRKLSTWLMSCVKEGLLAHPALRRYLLVTSRHSLVDFYKRHLGAWSMAEEEPQLTVMSGLSAWRIKD